MTTYRLWPSTNGGSLVAYTSTPFRVGMQFQVTKAGMWFTGYWWWVPTGGDTAAQPFALWQMNASSSGVLVPNSTVTSAALTADSWNFTALATPVELGFGQCYMAVTGWTPSHGFPDTSGYWGGAGTPGAAGIINGPLVGFSSPQNGGTANKDMWANGPVTFDTSGAAPAASFPQSLSSEDNFWLDVQVSDTAPSTWTGPYSIFGPKVNQKCANPSVTFDASVNYSIATEFHLSATCTLGKLWYYSPPGAAQLATTCDIWAITGANSGTKATTASSPAWKNPDGTTGTAGAGWLYCTFSGVTLPAGSYKASVYNSNATPDGWGAKSLYFWDPQGQANAGFSLGYGYTNADLVNGPLTAPALASASSAYLFNGSNPAGTPPYSNSSGTITEPGQATFYQPVSGAGSDTYPYLYVDGLAQNYWVDVEVTSAPARPGLLMATFP